MNTPWCVLQLNQIPHPGNTAFFLLTATALPGVNSRQKTTISNLGWNLFSTCAVSLTHSAQIPGIWHVISGSRPERRWSKGHPCPHHPQRDSLSLLILSGRLTYFGQGRQHDPERDFKGDLDVLIIQREEGVLRGVVSLGFLSSPADVLQDRILLQQRLLQGSHPGGLEDAGEPAPSQDSCSSVSLALHVPGSHSCSRCSG